MKKYRLLVLVAIIIIFSIVFCGSERREKDILLKSTGMLKIEKSRLENDKKALQVEIGLKNDLKAKYEELKNENEVLQQNVEELLKEVEELSMIRVKLSAYSPFDNQSGIEGGLKTSTGLDVGKMYCAADPKKIPYGSQFYIPDYGLVEVQDTGSALRRSNKLWLDLFHDTYHETVEFGIQEKDIQLIRWGN